MHRLTRAASAAAFVFAAAALTAAPAFKPAAHAEDSPSKRAAAERMTAAAGLDPVQIAGQIIGPVMTGVMQRMREENPDIPPRALEIMQEEFSLMARSMTGVLGPEAQNLSVELAMKHYTEDEINAVTAFHESPAGRKMAAAAAQIMQEAAEVMAAGGPDEPRCAGVSAARCAAAERLAKVDPTAQILKTLPEGEDRIKLLDWIITLNARHLSAEDMDAAAAFYGSPAGRKTAAAAAPMVNEVIGWMQNRMGEILQHELLAAMERIKTRMDAEGLTE